MLSPMFRTVRLVSLGLAMSLVGVVSCDAVTGTGGLVRNAGQAAYVEGDSEQQAQVERVLGLFSAAGMDLPPLVLISYRPLEWCPGRIKGRATPTFVGGDVDLCLHTDRALAHELAHLYLYTAMTDHQRDEFRSRRGLPTWNGRDVFWNERATEHAANLLVWWILDRHQEDFVYWKTRAETPAQDLGDLAWLLTAIGLESGVDDPSLDDLRQPSTGLLASAAPWPRQVGRRPPPPIVR